MNTKKVNKYFILRHLNSIEGIGLNKISSLVDYFKEPELIINSSIKELTKVDGISEFLATKITTHNFDDINLTETFEKDLNRLIQLKASFISISDENYPKLLKNIYSPPIILYILGNIVDRDKESIAIVGTRTNTSYGKKNTEVFATELAKNGVTIVSGLARGVDTLAHKYTIDAGGRTIAVIGSGIDVIYPKENKELFYRIIENGAVISEFEPGTKPDAINFPRRNRIISGLSMGVLIIETRIKGGAMQTASLALDQNKDVFAIPGEINKPFSEGTNYLIQKNEAKLVIKPSDILEEYYSRINISTKETKKMDLDLNLFEQKIYDVLSDEPIHIDEISTKTGLSTSDTLVNLLTIEFKGLIMQMPGKYFKLN